MKSLVMAEAYLKNRNSSTGQQTGEIRSLREAFDLAISPHLAHQAGSCTKRLQFLAGV